MEIKGKEEEIKGKEEEIKPLENQLKTLRDKKENLLERQNRVKRQLKEQQMSKKDLQDEIDLKQKPINRIHLFMSGEDPKTIEDREKEFMKEEKARLKEVIKRRLPDPELTSGGFEW